MAVIEKRTSLKQGTRYRVRVRLKDGRHASETFGNYENAKEWARKTEAALVESRHFPDRESRRRTVADLIDRFVKESLPAKKLRSADRQRAYLNWWKTEIGHVVLSELHAEHVADALRRLMAKAATLPSGKKGERRETGETISGATANRYKAAFSSACKLGAGEYRWLLAGNPCLGISRKAEADGRKRFLSADERERLLAECKKHGKGKNGGGGLYDAVVLSLHTAARRGELLSLRWCDVDLGSIDGASATFPRTKGGGSRKVPLVGEALTIMAARFDARPAGAKDTDLIFRGRKNHEKPLDVGAIFRRACARAGIKDFKWHDLRHSAASDLAKAGATPFEIQSVTGHKTLSMLSRYVHMDETHARDAIERMVKKQREGAR